jgi:hypothetical protein
MSQQSSLSGYEAVEITMPPISSKPPPEVMVKYAEISHNGKAIDPEGSKFLEPISQPFLLLQWQEKPC